MNSAHFDTHGCSFFLIFQFSHFRVFLGEKKIKVKTGIRILVGILWCMCTIKIVMGPKASFPLLKLYKYFWICSCDTIFYWLHHGFCGVQKYFWNWPFGYGKLFSWADCLSTSMRLEPTTVTINLYQLNPQDWQLIYTFVHQSIV